ncbi:unnamed protein product [Heterobilharzia americana]|nr:unnamed protein product [Heterobilharzia americana]
MTNITSEVQQDSVCNNRDMNDENQINPVTCYEMKSSMVLMNSKNREILQPDDQLNDYNGISINNSHSLCKTSMKALQVSEKSHENKQIDGVLYKTICNEKALDKIDCDSKHFPISNNNSTNMFTTTNTTDDIISRKMQMITNHYYPPYRNKLPNDIKQNEQYLDRSITSQSISLRRKCENFETETSQYTESIQISGITLTKDEIAAIINERDELYEILRANEEEASARYTTEKRLMTMKQEFAAEQQRLRQIITALEEELEVTMCRLNQLTAERSRWTTELGETKNERDEIKEKLKNAEENHKSELSELKDGFEDKIKQIKLEQTRRSEVIQKEFESRMNSSTNEQMQRIDELQERLEKLNRMHREMEQEKERLRIENLEIIKEHREKERQIRHEYEDLLENKSVEKGKEISKLMDVHSAQLNELVEQMQKEKIQVISDVRSCYAEAIQELQSKLMAKQTEIQKLNDTLTNTQSQLQESRSQEILEKLKVQTVEARSKELAEWEKEKFELWKIKMNELKDEKDACIETLKQELQEQKDLVKFYQDKLKTIQKECDIYQSESERKVTGLENQIETLKMKHEMDVREMQQLYNEKISNMEVKHNRELQKAIENEITTVQKQIQEENQTEKDKILEDVITLSTQITSKIGNLTTDIYQTLEVNVQGLYSLSDFNLDLDVETQTVLNKEITIPNMTRKWTIDNISIEEVLDSLKKYLDDSMNNLRTNSVYILTQIQQRKEILLTRIKSELENAHNTIKRTQQQADNDHEEYKEKLKQYRTRIEELEDDTARAKLIEQLKLKDNEIEVLKKEIQQLKQEIQKQMNERNQPHHGEGIERKYKVLSSLHQRSLSLNNNKIGSHNLVSQQPLQIIGELKARIQRLREENMALRRLLLRRPLLSVKQSDQESEQRPVCRLLNTQLISKLRSKEDLARVSIFQIPSDKHQP